MYTTCTYCYRSLGSNATLESFGVSRRVAFDPARGYVWAVCSVCARWNLAPIAERWETVNECERRFRRTSLRYSTGNVGMAWLEGDLDLIRIGPALRPEVAAWRYGRSVGPRRPVVARALGSATRLVSSSIRTLAAPRNGERGLLRHAVADTLLNLCGQQIADVIHLPRPAPDGDHPVAVVRLKHLLKAQLVRPEPGRPWSLVIPHDQGSLELEGETGLRAAARSLAVLNGSQRGRGFSQELLSSAVAKVEESARSDSYFNRVLTIALRTAWGRHQHDSAEVTTVDTLEHAPSMTERLAWRLTGRTFWGRGGIGSDPATALLDVPLVDRVALEMAAHEETERRAMEGELAELEAAWRDASEIATIADALLPSV